MSKIVQSSLHILYVCFIAMPPAAFLRIQLVVIVSTFVFVLLKTVTVLLCLRLCMSQKTFQIKILSKWTLIIFFAANLTFYTSHHRTQSNLISQLPIYISLYIYISGGPLSALTCCVNVRLLSAIKKISPLIYSQSWDGSWVYTTQAMMTFTLIF